MKSCVMVTMCWGKKALGRSGSQGWFHHESLTPKERAEKGTEAIASSPPPFISPHLAFPIKPCLATSPVPAPWNLCVSSRPANMERLHHPDAFVSWHLAGG